MAEIEATRVSRTIPWERARRLVRLSGEFHEIGNIAERRAHLVRSLLVELGASVGGIVHDRAYFPGGRRGIAAATLTGFDAGTLPVFAVHDTEGSDFNPFHARVMALRARGIRETLTLRCIDALASAEWDRSSFVSDLARPAGLDHFLGSLRLRKDGTGEGIAFMRARGDRPFSEEDRDVLHLLLHELPPLFHESTVPLAPRERQTLRLLLTGATNKGVAAELGISVNTAHQYVKTILRTHDVHSRAELVARYASRTFTLAEEDADTDWRQLRNPPIARRHA